MDKLKQPRKSEPLNAAEILAKGREPRKFLVTQTAKPDSGKKPLGIIPRELVHVTGGGIRAWEDLDLAGSRAFDGDATGTEEIAAELAGNV